MFDFVARRRYFVTFLLAIITLIFSFWGVSSYFSTSSHGDWIASVRGQDFSRDQFMSLYQDKQNQLKTELGQKYKSEQWNTPAMQDFFLFQWVGQFVWGRWVYDQLFRLSDVSLIQKISQMPLFSDKSGAFSRALYQKFLDEHHLTAHSFEEKIRYELTIQHFMSELTGSLSVSSTLLQSLAKSHFSDVRVVYQDVPLAPDIERAQPTDRQISDFYNDEKNSSLFLQPTTIRLEYLIWGQDQFPPLSLSLDEKKNYYHANRLFFTTPDTLNIFRIFISSPAFLSAEERGRRHQHALYVLSRVMAHASASHFKKIARLFSDDKISAENGGDMGFLSEDMMSPEWKQHVQSLKVGQNSSLVETPSGFYIFFLNARHPGRVLSFSEALPRIDKLLRTEKTESLIRKQLPEFTDAVENAVDQLKGVAQKYHLTVKSLSWVDQEKLKKNPLFHNERLLSDLFSQDSLLHHRNTDVVSLSHQRWIVARVTDVMPAHKKTLADVSLFIRRHLKEEEGREEAKKKALLIMNSPQNKHWSSPQLVSSNSFPSDFPESALEDVLQAKPGLILPPVFIEGKGYRVYKVLKRLSQSYTDGQFRYFQNQSRTEQANLEFFLIQSYLLNRAHFRVHRPSQSDHF